MIARNSILPIYKKNVAIVGLGISGLSAAKLVKKLGGSVILCDDSNLVDRDCNINSETLLSSELIILSPGVSNSHIAIQKAIKKGKHVINEIELAAILLKKCIFIGITGTNGKSTTAAMVNYLLYSIKNNTCCIAGNYGIPLCDIAIKKEIPKFIILELSSYQLETITSLKLTVAALLNLAPDHLDRYNDINNYYNFKVKIFTLLKKSGLAVINKDINKQVYTKILSSNLKIKFFSKSKKTIFLPNLFYMHNIENILCAVEIAKFFKLSHKTILDRLYRFVSLEHRLEFVCKKNNIVFINDSKATNVAATVKALHSLKGSIHLIIGGLGKNENYNPLLDASKNVKFVYAIGTEGRILNKKFKDICKSEFYFTLSDAVFHAKKNAKSGDVILFSPSCSSLDQFNNFSERGKYFKTLI